jgi:hypothetical protein
MISSVKKLHCTDLKALLFMQTCGCANTPVMVPICHVWRSWTANQIAFAFQISGCTLFVISDGSCCCRIRVSHPPRMMYTLQNYLQTCGCARHPVTDPCIMHVGIAELQICCAPKSLMCIIMILLPYDLYPTSCLKGILIMHAWFVGHAMSVAQTTVLTSLRLAVIKAAIIVNQPLWGAVLSAEYAVLLPTRSSKPVGCVREVLAALPCCGRWAAGTVTRQILHRRAAPEVTWPHPHTNIFDHHRHVPSVP